MEANITPELGRRLQQLLHRSTNPVSTRRAEIILSSALGSPVSKLSRDYHIKPKYIEDLITQFNKDGMKAITKGARGKRNHMVEEERSIIREVIRLTPQAFGQDQAYWEPDKLIEFITKRKLVKVIDEKEIKEIIYHPFP